MVDSALHLQVAARAYRTSFASLGVIIVFSALLLSVSTAAGIAAGLGGLVAWLPHVYMIGKVFGLSRRGVKAVNLGGLLAAEGIKFMLTAGLFVIAFGLVKADHAAYLLIGFIVAVVANLAASAALSRQLDKNWSPKGIPDATSELK